MKQKNFMARDPFFFHNGERAQSIQEFIEVLKKLDEDTFRFHANKTKNDFAYGFRYSMDNSALAGKIASLNSKEDIRGYASDLQLLGDKANTRHYMLMFSY